MNESEGFRVLLRSATPKPPPRRDPVYTPTGLVRSQQRQLSECLENLIRAVQKVDAAPETNIAFSEVRESAKTAMNELERIDRNEARYRLEEETAEPQKPLKQWDPKVRPVTDVPFHLVLMDYVDNVRTDTMAFVNAAREISGSVLDLNGVSEDGIWKIYDRLSGIFCLISSADSSLRSVEDLVVAWGVKDQAVKHWIKTSRRFLYLEGEEVRSNMARVRGFLK